MADQQYCLRWNNHQNTLISVFDSLQERGCMVDCTLGAEGQSLQAHKVVLSACSPYLEDLLTKHYDKHPILILKDVRFEELKAMVDYMYRGEVNVAHDKLNLFLRAAESLQIKGLSDSGTDPPDTGGTAGGTKRTSKGAPVSVRSNQQLTVRSTNLADDSRDGSVSPSQRKRRRRRGSDESDNDSSSNVADGKQSSAAAAPVTGPSVLNQDLLPTVPASVPADALLSSIMESAETDTATDSGLYANAVTPSSQENVILDKGSSDVLVQPKTEYLDDDTQDLALGDDDSVAGPSHSRSGNFMNDTDMFMADQDGSNNAQGAQRGCDKCGRCGGRRRQENARRASRTESLFECINRAGDRLRALRARTSAQHTSPDVRTIAVDVACGKSQDGPSPEDRGSVVSSLQDEVEVPKHFLQDCWDSLFAGEDSNERQIVSSSASGISLAAASGLDSPALLTMPVSSTPAPTTDAPTSNPADDPPREAAQPKKPAVAPVVSPKLSRPRGWPTTSVRLKSILRRNVAPVGQSCGSPAPPDHSRHSAARGSTAAETPRKPRVAWAVPSSAAALAHDSGAGASSPVDCQTARKLRPRKSRSPPGSRASLATRLITTEPPVDVNRELRCKECNILFKSAKTFVAHLRTHNKKRPFQCDQCEASFTEYWSLRYHHFRHTGLKPFQCPVCSRKFRARDSLTQHVAGQHTRETRYTCPHCQEKFCYRAEFHRHKRLNRACRLEVSQSEK